MKKEGIDDLIKDNRKILLRKVVILLGRTDKTELLKWLEIELEKQKLIAIIPGIQPFQKLNYAETPRQKLHGYISSAKFVIVEDTDPSGAIIELEYCRHVGVITAIIFRRCDKSDKSSGRSTFMTLDMELHSKDFMSFPYEIINKKTTKKICEQILKWVKGRERKRDKDFKELQRKINIRN